MPDLIADCPRCSSKRTALTLLAETRVGVHYEWAIVFEIFVVCRHCKRATIFLVEQSVVDDRRHFNDRKLVDFSDSINNHVKILRFVSMRDNYPTNPPAHLPENLNDVFLEGATCLNVGCYNAAATMFRLCVDIATRERIPPEDSSGPHPKNRRMMLGARLRWLFDHNLLPLELDTLSDCIKEDGNDGAHQGNLTKFDAEDLMDFTIELLRRLYTEPERLRIAKERRDKRRSESSAT